MTSFPLEEGNVKGFEKSICTEMDKIIEHLNKELLTIRTGKAHVGMIESIKVDCYGSIMNLKDIASLSSPDVNLLTIQPWDKNLIGDIERAISVSNLGLNPKVEADIIRLEVPRMSIERREELAKVVGKKVEECKVNVRNIRKDAQNIIRDSEKGKKISEDFGKRLSKTLQDVTDKYTEKSEQLGLKKSNELKSL